MSRIIPSEDGKLIGFSIKEDQGLVLTVPKFIENIPKDNKSVTEEFFKYYKIFKVYKTQYKKQTSVKEYDNFRLHGEVVDKENSYYFSIIELYFSLLKDYEENGLLLFREKSCNLKPKGQINWNRTINKSTEIITENSIIYNGFYYNNLNFTYGYPVTILHACALMNLEKLLDTRFHLPYDYRFLKNFENSKNHKLAILKKYKREMFSDREKKIFNLLEKLYYNENKANYITMKGKELNFAENFNLIWEKMLKTILKDEYEIFKKHIPIGNYTLKKSLKDKEVTFNGLSPIPDILISRKYSGREFLFIIDAKNYVPDFKEETGMPGSSDIVKQILYRYLLSKEFTKNNRFNMKNIINVFLLPSELKGERIRYIGMHNLEEKFEQREIGRILCFYIDFDFVVENFLSYNQNYSDEILNYIFNIYKKYL